MLIHVTQQDIDLANQELKERVTNKIYFRSQQCPVAKAIRRELGNPKYHIGVTPFDIDIDGHFVKLDERTNEFIKMWDKGYGMEPFEFSLEFENDLEITS